MPRAFSLQTVLALRQRREETEERALAAANAELQQLMVQLGRVESELQAMAEARARETQAVHAAAHHQTTFARYSLLRSAQAALRVQLEAAETTRNKQQLQYLAARTDREMLSELKQQQTAAWKAEVQTREQKMLDDLFTARRLRN